MLFLIIQPPFPIFNHSFIKLFQCDRIDWTLESLFFLQFHKLLWGDQLHYFTNYTGPFELQVWFTNLISMLLVVEFNRCNHPFSYWILYFTLWYSKVLTLGWYFLHSNRICLVSEILIIILSPLFHANTFEYPDLIILFKLWFERFILINLLFVQFIDLFLYLRLCYLQVDSYNIFKVP